MGCRKFEVKYIENNISRQVTFSKCRPGNIEIAVSINSSTEIPYVYCSPRFDDVLKRFQQNPSAKRVRSSPSMKKTKIPKSQAKLDHLMVELKQNKEPEKVLKKEKEENLENYNMKEIIDLKLEDLGDFTEKLEDLKRKQIEMEASLSLLMLSKNKNKKRKKMMRTEFPSRQCLFPDKKTYEVYQKKKTYELRKRKPTNYSINK